MYFALYKDPENAEDDAELSDIERARMAADGRRFRAFLDDLQNARTRLRS